jgi:hypothetical protein
MAEDSTRRLLRVFGIAVTDCEDALGELETALRGSGTEAVAEQGLETYDRAAREMEARWAEVERLIHAYQARAREALLAGLRARGVG